MTNDKGLGRVIEVKEDYVHEFHSELATGTLPPQCLEQFITSNIFTDQLYIPAVVATRILESTTCHNASGYCLSHQAVLVYCDAIFGVRLSR